MPGAPPRSIDLERHEAKYLVHPSLLPALRAFAGPFCEPDQNAGDGRRDYLVTTLQLDSPDLALYRAREQEQPHRFKLRVRTYGTDGSQPVFLEIKRKIRGLVVKSRARLEPAQWGGTVCREVDPRLALKAPGDEHAYLEFVRLVREIGARPAMLLRYRRESYLGRNDRYARLTFDTRLCYRPARDWNLLPDGGRWRCMDTATAHGRPFSGAIVEIKTFGDAPRWMVDMTERFDLVRVGFCKYACAVRLEAVFAGGAYSEAGEPVEAW